MPFAIVLAYEIIFFLVVAGFLMLFRQVLINIATKFGGANPYAVSPEAVSAIKSFFYQSIAATLGLLLLIFIAYIILQGFAWLQVVGGKHSIRYFGRFVLVNLAWFIPWLVVMWFFIVGLQGSFAATGLIVLAILFTHLTFIMQHAFASDKSYPIKKSMGKAFSIGIGKIHLFIIPYLLATIVFFIWSQIWRLIPQTNFNFALIVLATTVFAPFLAWFKFYLHRLLTSFA